MLGILYVCLDYALTRMAHGQAVFVCSKALELAYDNALGVTEEGSFVVRNVICTEQRQSQLAGRALLTKTSLEYVAVSGLTTSLALASDQVV
jgi:hypothetical protein